MDVYYESLNYMRSGSTQKDPVTKLFFKDDRHSTDRLVEDLIFERTNTPIPQDVEKKRHLIAKEARAKHARKHGRRRRRYKKEHPVEEPPAPTAPEKTISPDEFDDLTRRSTTELLAQNTTPKKRKRKSLFDTLLSHPGVRV